MLMQMQPENLQAVYIRDRQKDAPPENQVSVMKVCIYPLQLHSPSARCRQLFQCSPLPGYVSLALVAAWQERSSYSSATFLAQSCLALVSSSSTLANTIQH